MTAIFVGIGGGLGAMCRYGISLLPYKGAFPLLTLITNLLGAIIIGAIVELADRSSNTPSWAMPLLKTGFCGGFTTFSTFSLEAAGLMQSGRYFLMVLYAALSLVLCICGVFLGRSAVKLIRG